MQLSNIIFLLLMITSHMYGQRILWSTLSATFLTWIGEHSRKVNGFYVIFGVCCGITDQLITNGAAVHLFSVNSGFHDVSHQIWRVGDINRSYKKYNKTYGMWSAQCVKICLRSRSINRNVVCHNAQWILIGVHPYTIPGTKYFLRNE